MFYGIEAVRPLENQLPVFVTSVYGEAYSPFIFAHLFSLQRHYPDAKKHVFWQEVPSSRIIMLSNSFPIVTFTEVNEAITGPTHQRIASKLDLWAKACYFYPDKPICFLDCDTVLVRPISDVLSNEFGEDVDALFTWKDEVFPLNTGVFIIRSGQVGALIVEEWNRRTKAILSNRKRCDTGISISGAPDQHALREIIGWANYDRSIDVSLQGRSLKFRGVECKYLNEGQCKPISEETHIIHYKSGWHRILLDRSGYHQHRPQTECSEMWEYYQRLERGVQEHSVKEFILQCCAKSIGVFGKITDAPDSAPGKIDFAGRLALYALSQCFHLNTIFVIAKELPSPVVEELRHLLKTVPIEIIPIPVSVDKKGLRAPFQEATKTGRARGLLTRPRHFSGTNLAILFDGFTPEEAMWVIDRLPPRSGEAAALFLCGTNLTESSKTLLLSRFRQTFFMEAAVYTELLEKLSSSEKNASAEQFVKAQSNQPSMAIAFPFRTELYRDARHSLRQFIRSVAHRLLRRSSQIIAAYKSRL